MPIHQCEINYLPYRGGGGGAYTYSNCMGVDCIRLGFKTYIYFGIFNIHVNISMDVMGVWAAKISILNLILTLN